MLVSMGDVVVEFHEVHAAWMATHTQRRSNPHRRLLKRHGPIQIQFLSDVWWPLFRNFSDLHPAYETAPGNPVDFAYVQPHFRLAMVIVTWWSWSDRENASRVFDHDCLQQNHLVLSGWHCLRFTPHMIATGAHDCQETIRQLLCRWTVSSDYSAYLTVHEREVIRYAARSPMPITPNDVRFQLGVGPDYAQRLMRGLVQKQWLLPASGQLRIRSYHLHPSRTGVRL